MNHQPLFIVPSDLTKDIAIRQEPVSSRVYKRRSAYAEAIRRRKHLKLTLRQRHAHRIDESIARLEERLEILKEIRNES